MSNAPHNSLTPLPVRTDKLPLPGLLALFSAAFTAVMTELLPAGVLPQMSAGLQVPARHDSESLLRHAAEDRP